jgi:hypothetical protein
MYMGWQKASQDAFSLVRHFLVFIRINGFFAMSYGEGPVSLARLVLDRRWSVTQQRR